MCRPGESCNEWARAAAQRRDTEQFVLCLLRIIRDPEVMATSLERLAAAWRALPGEHRERAHQELLAKAEGKAARAALAAALGEERDCVGRISATIGS